MGGGCLEISSDWILHIGYISGNTREHITCFEKPYSMFMVSPLQALMEDQVQYLDSLQRSYQNQIRNHELSMIRTRGQIVTTKKRTLTKFLGVDKHMIPGDPIRGNNDICNNNYLVLYDVVSDVESDVLDKTDRTGYLCVRQRCVELSKSAFCVQQIDASKEIKYRIENRSRYVMFINYNNHSCFKCKYHE